MCAASARTLLADSARPAVLGAMLERLAAAGVSDEQGRRLDVRDRVSPVVVGRVCDDEPLLRTEAALGATQPDRLVRGLAAAGILCGADDLLLAVSEDDRGSLLALERRVQGSRVRLQPISPGCRSTRARSAATWPRRPGGAPPR